jgi:hypothetical protein
MYANIAPLSATRAAVFLPERLCNFDTFKKEAPRLADSSNDPRPTKLGMPVAELIAA